MARPVLILLSLFVASAALADARELHFHGGNSAGRPINQGMSYSVEGDRNAAGQVAVSEAILQAARGELKASLATSVGTKAAAMTTRRSAGLKTFDSLSGGRRLQDSGTTSNSDRVQLALSGAQDTIAMAVNSGASLQSAKAAAATSMVFARLAGKLSARGSDFNRRLHFHGGNSAGRPINQGMSYSVEGDRNAAGQGAASEAILQAARGELKASLATSVGTKAAAMTTRRSAGLKTFDSLSGGRRLQDSGTTSNSDRVQLALSGAQDTIAMAVNSGASLKSAKAAAATSMALARLAGKLSARGSDFTSP